MPGISNGPNSRPLNDTIAETGPGIPDDAVADGELNPAELSQDIEAGAEALRRRGWASRSPAQQDGEGHPS